jgi:hypothetical protein
MEEKAFKYGGYIRIFTKSFSTNKFTVFLLCISLVFSFYMFRLNMQELIRIEVQNSRTVHLLGLKETVNKLTMHRMRNMTVDTNIFDK